MKGNVLKKGLIVGLMATMMLTGCGKKGASDSGDISQEQETLVDTSQIEMTQENVGGFLIDFPKNHSSKDNGDIYYVVSEDSNGKIWINLSDYTSDTSNLSNINDGNISDFAKGYTDSYIDGIKDYQPSEPDVSYSNSDDYLKIRLSCRIKTSVGDIYSTSYTLGNKLTNHSVTLTYYDYNESLPYLDFFEDIIKDVAIDPNSKPSETPAGDNSDVDPDLKAFLDSYEQFVDDYIAFMQKYQQNPTDMTLLSDYTDYMSKYAQFAQDVSAWSSKQDQMSAADLNYYLEVTTRCSQKLANAAISTQ